MEVSISDKTFGGPLGLYGLASVVLVVNPMTFFFVKLRRHALLKSPSLLWLVCSRGSVGPGTTQWSSTFRFEPESHW